MGTRVGTAIRNLDPFKKLREETQVGEPEDIDFSLSIEGITAGFVKRVKLWNEKKELPGHTE